MKKSRQLNFFITPADRNEIAVFLNEKGIRILSDESLNSDHDNHGELPKAEDEIYQFFLTRKEFLDEIDVNTIEDSGKRFYSILTSPLLEFCMGGFYPYNRNLLQRARLYFCNGYYGDDNIYVNKSDEFLSWAQDVTKQFKKKFLKVYPKQKDFLYSKNAIEWIEANEAKYTNGGQEWEKQVDKIAAKK